MNWWNYLSIVNTFLVNITQELAPSYRLALSKPLI